MTNKQEKKKFEIKMGINQDHSFSKNIYVDGELFDWSINEKDFQEVIKSKDPRLIMAVQQDIAKHFLASLSEFVGKRLTFEDIKNAEKTGWI